MVCQIWGEESEPLGRYTRHTQETAQGGGTSHSERRTCGQNRNKLLSVREMFFIKKISHFSLGNRVKRQGCYLSSSEEEQVCSWDEPQLFTQKGVRMKCFFRGRGEGVRVPPEGKGCWRVLSVVGDT